MKSLRRRCDPYQFAPRLQHSVTAGPNSSADRVRLHIANGTDTGEIFGIVVDYLVSAEAAHIGVIASAGRRDHGGAEMLAKLNSKSRDAAGTSLDQNSLASFEARRIF